MSDSMSHGNDGFGSEDTKSGDKPVRQIRTWPAVVILLAYAIAFGILISMPTVIANAIGVLGTPSITTILLALWWLFFSRVSWRERIIGLLLFAATLLIIVYSQPPKGHTIIVIAMPVLTTSIVLMSLLTCRAPNRVRQIAVFLVMAACAIVFPMFRVADQSYALAPILTWRWTPTADEILAATGTIQQKNQKADVPAQAGPSDWPGFRGAGRDSRVEGVRFGTNWSSAPPKQVWRKPVGLGYSSFVVVGDYAFTQEQRQENETVVCYKASTGEQIWQNTIKARFEESTGTGPRATPMFEAGKLYTQGATGILQCLDASTGNVIWKKDILAETGAKLQQWGIASSPLLTEKLVVMFTAGGDKKSVVAFDKITGERIWCSGKGAGGYSSAQLSTVAGVPQILIASSFGVQSLAVDTGIELWNNEWRTNMNPRVVQPMVYDGNAVLIGTADGKGTRCLQLAQADNKWTVTEKWTTTVFRPYFNDFVFHKGYCYGFDGDTFDCIDAHTGERKWVGTKYGGQVLLVVDMEMLLVLTNKGDVVLVRAVPDSFQEVARFKALTGKTWNHPVIAHGKLFVRNEQEAACFELPAA